MVQWVQLDLWVRWDPILLMVPPGRTVHSDPLHPRVPLDRLPRLYLWRPPARYLLSDQSHLSDLMVPAVQMVL